MSGTSGSVAASSPGSEYEILCDDVGAFMRRYVPTGTGTLSPIDTDLDGAMYEVTGPVRRCAPSAPPPNPVIGGALQQQQGAGTITVPAGARSVTLVVLAGTASVGIGAAPAVTVPAGTSLTWSVDRGGDTGESLRDAYTLTGTAGSDFLVSTTREV